jgi:hypothetical protein
LTESRFSAVSRRAVLQGLSATAVLGLVGCASDAQVLPASGSSTSSGGATSAASSATGDGLKIAFTYTAASNGGGPGGGMVRNPYIAVWIEDSAGALVKTVSLWHLQNGQDRWLSELSQWYQAAQGVEANSSATRAPGTYTVVWDLTDTAGAAVSHGTYTVCIEALREHGSHSLVTGKVAVKGGAISQTLDDNAELSAITLAYQP